MTSPTSRTACALLDAADPLGPFRGRFQIPEGLIYLDGNSLGALPAATPARLAEVVERQWGTDLIASWNRHDWIGMPQRLGDKIAGLIGARPGEVVVSDSTSVNLFKVLTAALRLKPGRSTVVARRGDFPTDLYIVQGLSELTEGRVRLRFVEDDEDPADVLDDDVAVLLLTEVDYRTGRRHDMERLTRAAHAHRALAIWDLSHSAGAFPVDLNGADADFAVGCGYKYLNGGPGAPAFLFVAERWQDAAVSGLTGWLGHGTPFTFDPIFEPAEGIRRFQVGTPSILSMAALEVGIDIMREANMDAVRAKSLALTDLFMDLVERTCPGLDVATPRPHEDRGSQVSLRHPDAYAVMQALIARGIVGDFRAPDILRFGFAPLYVRYVDVWDAVVALRHVLDSGEWKREEFRQRAAVT